MAYYLRTFQSDYSIFTNFKPDHLNWHKSLQEYLDAKMHVIEHTKKLSCINDQVINFAQENSLYLERGASIKIFGLQKHRSP